MSVIGEVIKKAIDFTGFITSDAEPVEAQELALRELLEKAKHTAFGMRYKFAELLQEPNLVEAFQWEVPVHYYDKMFDEWWHYLLEGH